MATIEELVNELELEGAAHEHEWWVLGMRNYGRHIGCQCRVCGALGAIGEHSMNEFEAAISAPDNPYRWTDNDRVRLTVRLPIIDSNHWTQPNWGNNKATN